MHQRSLRPDSASLYSLLGDHPLVHDAFDLADRVHEGQMRTLAAGKVPYILHPLFVFFQLRAWGVTDRTCLISALLHDTVEDAPDEVWQCAAPPFPRDAEPAVPRERALLAIDYRFGDDVAPTVNGLSNVPGVPWLEHLAESTKDPRVLVTKLGDFTHNALMLDSRHPRAAKLSAKYAPGKPLLAGRLAKSPEAQSLLPAWREVHASLT